MNEYDEKPKRKRKPKQQRYLLVPFLVLIGILIVFCGVLWTSTPFRFDTFMNLFPATYALTVRSRTIEAQHTETAISTRSVSSHTQTPINATGMAAVPYTQTATVPTIATLEPVSYIPCVYVWDADETIYREDCGTQVDAECFWQWYAEPLSDITQVVRATLDEADINAIANIYSFGRSCSQRDGTGNEIRVPVIGATFEFTISVTNISDTSRMGDIAAAILRIVANYPPNETPGTNAGGITFRFVEDEIQLEVFVGYPTAIDLLEAGLTGTDLFNALQS